MFIRFLLFHLLLSHLLFLLPFPPSVSCHYSFYLYSSVAFSYSSISFYPPPFIPPPSIFLFFFFYSSSWFYYFFSLFYSSVSVYIIGVNPGGLGVATSQILGWGSWGS